MSKPYVPFDKWARRAQGEGFRARSVYKLMELDERFRLLKPGMKVLDIGAAPGSWLQYVSRSIGPSGRALGLDLVPLESIAANVITKVCDIQDYEGVRAAIREVGFDHADLILSDIAPNTSGIRDVDQWRSIALSQRVVEIARQWLAAKGTLVMKVFRGGDFDEFLGEVRREFRSVKLVSPKASRDRSKEVYMVCQTYHLPGFF